MKNIATDKLDTITGGATTSSTLQTALTGVTSALDSLKQNQNKGGLDQLLPVVVMARWMRQQG